MPIFSRLARTFAWNYALQLGAAAVFIPLHTEKYYDLLGSAGFLSASFVSLYSPWIAARLRGEQVPFPPLTAHAPRQLLLTGCLMLWSSRLGYFLFSRVLREGKDSRFDKIKYEPATFAFFWFMQATWVSLVGLPVYLANALPATAHKPLGPRDYAGLALFAGSLAFEAIADQQKSSWRKAKTLKKHSEEFITSGLWSISRHPNYVGEVGIHTGIWLLSTQALSNPAYPMGTAIFAALGSPIFTYFLLAKLSGVPPLERAGDKKFGGNPNWESYKSRVPIFFPWMKP
ncbi:DUF1295-domain-containing protein [Clavulina sp. PMI_390]|nr:DUF1295-domain-containing protein [Clavulina sp. PMI_390]